MSQGMFQPAMMKRERDELLERVEGVGNGNKIQRLGGQFSDRAPEDSKSTAIQDASANLSAKKQVKQQVNTGLKGPSDVRHELYKEGRRFKVEGSSLPEGNLAKLLVHIQAEHLQIHNRQVKARQLWGVDTYTHDSDLVAILMHCGYISSSTDVPGDTISEAQVLIEHLPRLPAYPSCHRNGVRSRAWGEYKAGYSLKVVRCALVSRGGQTEELHPSLNGAGAILPTFTPSQLEPAVSTRASASSVERRQRAMQEVPMQYNLCNEPWLKYSMPVIADRGLKPSQLTSARLFKEVLYLETARQRFEISLEDHLGPEEQPDPRKTLHYRLARCKKAYSIIKMRMVGIPLPAEEVEVLQSGLRWDDFQWSSAGLSVKDQEYLLLRLHFTKKRSPPTFSGSEQKAGLTQQSQETPRPAA